MPIKKKVVPPAKMGRPKLSSTSTSHLGIKIAKEDRDLIERAAEKARRSISDWCRLALIDAASAELQQKGPRE